MIDPRYTITVKLRNCIKEAKEPRKKASKGKKRKAEEDDSSDEDDEEGEETTRTAETFRVSFYAQPLEGNEDNQPCVSVLNIF